jgi:hypothetical protein
MGLGGRAVRQLAETDLALGRNIFLTISVKLAMKEDRHLRQTIAELIRLRDDVLATGLCFTEVVTGS